MTRTMTLFKVHKLVSKHKVPRRPRQWIQKVFPDDFSISCYIAEAAGQPSVEPMNTPSVVEIGRAAWGPGHSTTGPTGTWLPPETGSGRRGTVAFRLRLHRHGHCLSRRWVNRRDTLDVSPFSAVPFPWQDVSSIPQCYPIHGSNRVKYPPQFVCCTRGTQLYVLVSSCLTLWLSEEFFGFLTSEFVHWFKSDSK